MVSTAEYRYRNADVSHHSGYVLEPLLAMLPTGRRLRILDLGCGNGNMTNELALSGHDVTGADASASAIAVAEKSFPLCRFFRADVEQGIAGIVEGDFDVVVSIETIEHLPNPRALPAAARSVLRPGGQLIVTTPYHGYLKNLALSLTGKMDNHFTALWDGGHIKFFSVATLSKLLESEGFTDPRFKFAGRLPWLWKSMICSSRVQS
jgi:2-polyprenyl-3-methyl-5-hydroxy-6-metoxy-1,4-benzoquinol methylase